MLVRSLVVLLVVMNLGAAAWWALHRADAAAPLPPERAAPRLVLLSEAERSRHLPEAEASAAPEPIEASPVCLSLGPLQTPADMRRVMDTLSPGVGRIQYRETRGNAVRGYRVYLPASPSREAALDSARRLAAQGVRDYYVVTAGAQENTVSLGLFRDLRNAESRRDEIRNLGYEAALEPRTEEVPQWWVDIATTEDFDWRAALGGYAGIEARPIDCF
ncbi:SPOR domain-containing protein [Coralloluteibacterium thermophilus]|uniref:SPOR domain-containing protein n=1 Tax=Coralloluteibacterium thermophilum TaxID=2707049 RepID=A0ABV9NGC8_9GAMM